MVNDWDEDEGGRPRGSPKPWSPLIPVRGREIDTLLKMIFVEAGFFRDGILLPANAEPEGTAVGSVSWGRIKASLEME